MLEWNSQIACGQMGKSVCIDLYSICRLLQWQKNGPVRILCHRNFLIFYFGGGPLLWHKNINGIKRFTLFFFFLCQYVAHHIFFFFSFSPPPPLTRLFFLLVSWMCHSIGAKEREREATCVPEFIHRIPGTKKSGCVYLCPLCNYYATLMSVFSHPYYFALLALLKDCKVGERPNTTYFFLGY